jgi:hypothetical protein
MNPYKNLPKDYFWKYGALESSPFSLENIYVKKFEILKHWKIATAGSCFAQHIAKHLNKGGYKIIDAEPAPFHLRSENHSTYGYSMYSARYGNLYTAQQLLQLAKEVVSGQTPSDSIWEQNGRHYDAFRPSIEPNGLSSKKEVEIHRAHHIKAVRKVFEDMDLFVFTLGLTEAWVNDESQTVYPTAPGVIAGTFDAEVYSFKNFSFYECINAFNEFQDVLRTIRGDRPFPRILLTVSPVPLTATASGEHILKANTYSKSTLRAVAGHLSDFQDHIDYFPSYEIITNPNSRSLFYESNLRNVRKEGVEAVMRVFSSQHHQALSTETDGIAQNGFLGDVQCEEELLEVFGK